MRVSEVEEASLDESQHNEQYTHGTLIISSTGMIAETTEVFFSRGNRIKKETGITL